MFLRCALTNLREQLELIPERDCYGISCRIDYIKNPYGRYRMAEHRGGSGNFAEDREKASEAGKKGGQHSGGNFKNDPERASEAGKKGGQNSHSGDKK